jgi:O-antigen/teichoic acid export membrane protein
MRIPGLNQMLAPKRLLESAVAWSWAFNALRLASGLVILPLVLQKLSAADLGMYYVLLSIIALAPIIDFGFGPTIGRFVSYAMGGAQSIQAHGLPETGSSGKPNYPLLWRLLFATRLLYRYMAIILLVVLGAWGTYAVELRIDETSSPFITRLAWITALGATLFEIYSSCWGVYLRGLNQVTISARIGVIAMFVRIAIAAALLLAGAGLLSLPLAGFVSSLIHRRLARARCLELLRVEPQPAPDHTDINDHFRLLWPNSWRLGVQLMSGYLTVNANTLICTHKFGLEATGRYGLSVQLMGIAMGMAAVWVSTRWPLIGQYQARRQFALLQAALRPRVWLQNATYLALATTVVLAGPALMDLFGKDKELLPVALLLLLAGNSFLELQFTTWGTLISTQNRLPYLWPTVATNVLSLTLTLVLVHATSLGLGALVLGPLIAGSLFNYWYWPPYAARSIGTTLFRFLFTGPLPNDSHGSATANAPTPKAKS